MLIRPIFSNRLTLLKKTYSLSYSEMASMFGFKYKSGISEWINSQKSFPNEIVLVIISNIFAVSIDWLLGRIDEPYNEKVLTSLEAKYAVPFLSIALGKAAMPLPKIYTRTDLRRKNYTHGQRANLIFAALSSHYKVWNSTSKTMGKEVDPELLRSYILKIEGIDLLLSRELKKPLWDLEKAFMTHKKAD